MTQPRSGPLVGQPLRTYSGNLTAGDQLIGQQMWNPSSTAVLLQEATRQRPPADANPQVAQLGLTPHRLAVAWLPRRPTKPLSVATSHVGAWAPAPQEYHATIAFGLVRVTVSAGSTFQPVQRTIP